jgi:hypothetical protein
MHTYISGLLHPDMKTARATEHLQHLNELIERFARNEPYTVTEKHDSANRRYIIRFQLNSASPRIPILVGEFAYSLRSALDQLVWQLALLSGRRPGNKSAFPIQSSDGQRHREAFRWATWNVPCEAAELIKTFQPYTRGNGFKSHPLWQLNKLCNLDKHTVIGVSHTWLQVKTSGPPVIVGQRELDQAVELAIPEGIRDQVKFEPQLPEMVFGKPIDVPGPDFTLTKADLTEIHRFVRDDVVPSFARFFPNGQRLAFLPTS